MTNNLAQQILRDVQRMSDWELQSAYGIDIIDGRVWDSLDQKEFPSLAEWAQHAALVEDDGSYGTFTKIGGRSHDDDD